MTLRTRLLIVLVTLLTVGLASGAAVTCRALEHYLLSRVDQQVRAAYPLIEQDVLRVPGNRPDDNGFLVGTYGALIAGDGHLLCETTPRPGGDSATTARPKITPVILRATRLHPDVATVGLRTVPGEGGVRHYRVLTERLTNGDVLVVAVPLTQLDDTFAHLTHLEITVSLVLAAVLALLGSVILRFGLRPLTRMERTADAIAAGDLTRRVDHANPRTEAGRLGLALNGMLSQIEVAFREREASERRLRRFVADASHELRTPLTSIRGYAEMFRRGAAARPADLAMAMRRIEDEAGRMGDMVDDLLLLARLDQGRPLERQPVDLTEIALDAATDVGALSPGRPVEVDAPGRVEVTGDAGRLRQAVTNLVRNAVVHTPPDTLVRIGVRRDDPDAVLSVVDHGPGIPPAATDVIFERFYRADPGRARDAGGTGLGLSIVAAVVGAHGGRVEHSPTPGGGATFTLTIPVDLGRAPVSVTHDAGSLDEGSRSFSQP
jgi:two-component system, OmpR family, sensor kinase